MDEHSLSILEFRTIIDALCSYCVSGHGAELVRSQAILSDSRKIAELHKRVDYFKMLLESDSPFPEVSFPEIRDSVNMSSKPGTSLEGLQLAHVGVFIRSARRLGKYLSRDLSDAVSNTLKADAEGIPNLDQLAAGIARDFEEDGSIRDTVPSLRSIRRRLRNTQSAVQSLASGYFHGSSEIWQTDVPTIKDGRTVLPLKANYRGRVKGLVREVSPSGATIFIEPYDIVDKNNELSMLEHEYAVEVARILREHTDRLREHVPDILQTIETVSYLDSICARARYSIRYMCRRAEHSDRGFDLRNARHPMLGRSAVPINVAMAPETRALIITGPNAGGKTVTLKTVGLLAVMHQFGMHVPADEGSRLAIFDNVFADIGDDQSIQASLSTFSGHMKNISRFAGEGTARSLVLLDELGSGTDPEEGSAMAMAILDHFRRSGSTVIATTHHTVLKNYGYTTEGVLNASMAFDGETHRPTYHVILGVPGESHALDIALDSGVPADIVDAARNYIEEQSTDVATIIREITHKQQELRKREAAFEDMRSDMLEKARETDLRALRLKQRELELRTQGYQDLQKQMNEYRSRLENLVRELRESGATDVKTKDVKEYISDIEETAHQEKQQIEQVKKEVVPDRDLEPGMDVVVGKSKQRGTIVRAARDGYWVVATDRMKVTLPEDQIVPAERKEPEEPKVTVSGASAVESPKMELDLRGYRLNEALEAVERQIDRALLSGLHQFEVIHGHGQGILKNGIRNALRDHESVDSYAYAGPEAGGYGKTIVKLRS